MNGVSLPGTEREEGREGEREREREREGERERERGREGGSERASDRERERERTRYTFISRLYITNPTPLAFQTDASSMQC